MSQERPRMLQSRLPTIVLLAALIGDIVGGLGISTAVVVKNWDTISQKVALMLDAEAGVTTIPPHGNRIVQGYSVCASSGKFYDGLNTVSDTDPEGQTYDQDLYVGAANRDTTLVGARDHEVVCVPFDGTGNGESQAEEEATQTLNKITGNSRRGLIVQG